MKCERDRCPKCGTLAEIVEHSSRSFDPARQGIGSSAILGDRSNTFLPVPRAFTPKRTERYLFQLAQMEVPAGYRGTVTSLWQGLRIGSFRQAGLGADATQVPVTIPVTDSMFEFPDGNCSWSLVWRPGKPYNDALYEPVPQPGRYPGLRSKDSGLLYLPNNSRYVPPNAGDPGGDPVGSLTGFTHLRFPPNGQYPALWEQRDGPGVFAFLVSLWQTNPATRMIWTPTGGTDLSGFTQEQRFIWAQNATEVPGDTKPRYMYVAGGFTAQARPLCCDERRTEVVRWGHHVPVHANPGLQRPS